MPSSRRSGGGSWLADVVTASPLTPPLAPRRPVAVPIRPVNDDELLAELTRLTAEHGSGERLARRLGVESAHLRGMKSGREPVSRKVARGLGFELRWVKVKQAE